MSIINKQKISQITLFKKVESKKATNSIKLTVMKVSSYEKIRRYFSFFSHEKLFDQINVNAKIRKNHLQIINKKNTKQGDEKCRLMRWEEKIDDVGLNFFFERDKKDRKRRILRKIVRN